MPIYDYECPSCTHVFEKMRKIAYRRDKLPCPQCKATASFKVSAPAGIDAGTGDGYRSKYGSTGVWKTDMGPSGKIGKEWYGDNPHAPSTLKRD